MSKPRPAMIWAMAAMLVGMVIAAGLVLVGVNTVVVTSLSIIYSMIAIVVIVAKKV